MKIIKKLFVVHLILTWKKSLSFKKLKPQNESTRPNRWSNYTLPQKPHIPRNTEQDIYLIWWKYLMICLDLLEQTHMPRDLEKFYLRKKVVGFWALLYTYVEIDVFPSKKCPKQICTRLKRLHIICQERALFDMNRIFLGIGFDEKRVLKTGSDWLNNSV